MGQPPLYAVVAGRDGEARPYRVRPVETLEEVHALVSRYQGREGVTNLAAFRLVPTETGFRADGAPFVDLHLDGDQWRDTQSAAYALQD